MTTTDPTTRPIHQRLKVEVWHTPPSEEPGSWCEVTLDGDTITCVSNAEADAFSSLIAAAGKTHAVLVNLPDCAGGGQIVTWSYPSGAVEAAWRENPSATWTPVDMLGGSVEVAP